MDYNIRHLRSQLSAIETRTKSCSEVEALAEECLKNASACLETFFRFSNILAMANHANKSYLAGNYGHKTD